MQKTSSQIFADRSLMNVEDSVVSVSEVFRIQGASELQKAEKLYLPVTDVPTNAIVLAAGQGDLGELTRETPKCMLKVNSQPIISIQASEFNKLGIKDISVVRGFAGDKITLTNVSYVENPDYNRTKALR